MLGWFVTSGYFQNDSVLYVKECFKKAFEKHGVEFCHVKSNEKICYIDNDGQIKLQAQKPDFVVFWDKDVLFANGLEKLGIKVFNNSKSIEICDDKAKTAVALAGCGEKKTLSCDNCGADVQVAANSEMTDEWIIYCEECEASLGFDTLVSEE